jgi:hypothetical protein
MVHFTITLSNLRLRLHGAWTFQLPERAAGNCIEVQLDAVVTVEPQQQPIGIAPIHYYRKISWP